MRRDSKERLKSTLEKVYNDSTAKIAKLVEHVSEKHGVPSSILGLGTTGESSSVG